MQLDLAYTFNKLKNSSTLKSLLRRGGGVFMIQVVGVFGAYVLQVLLAGWMGAAAFGDYIYAYNWARLLALLGELGLTLSVLKFVPDYLAAQDWGHLRGVIRAFTGLVLLSSAVFALMAMIGFTLFPPEDIDLTTLLIGLAFTPIFALTYLYMETLRGMNHIFLAYAPINIGQNVLVLIFAAAVFVLAGSLSSVEAVSILAVVITLICIYQVIVILRRLPEPARTVKAVYEIGYWLKTSLPMLFIRGFTIIMERVDIIMVGLFLGAVPTGIYAVASRTAALTSFAMAAADAITAQQISPLYTAGKKAELEDLVRQVTRLSFAVSVLIFIGLAITGNFLLSLFGEEFLPGYVTLIILCIGQLVNAGVGPVGYLMHLTGHQHISSRIYAIATVVNVILNVILLPTLGIEGAAIATTSTIILHNVWTYFCVRKYLQIDTLPVRLW